MSVFKYIIIIGGSLFVIGYIVKSICVLVKAKKTDTKKGDNVDNAK